MGLLSESDAGLSVANEGEVLRLSVPLMTDEMRQKIRKILNEKLETARIGIRGVRDKVKDEIQKAEKAKEISEDDKYALIDELEDMVKEYNQAVKDLGEKKDTEISV